MTKTKLKGTQGLCLRGRIWWLRWTWCGARHCVSLETDDLATAIGKAAEIRANPDEHLAAAAAALGEPGDDVPAWRESLIRRGMSDNWRDTSVGVTEHALREMGATDARVVSAAQVEAWLAQTRERTSQNTAAMYHRILKAFFAWMVEQGRMKASPMVRVVAPRVLPNIRRTFLSKADSLRLLDECADEALKFCLYCALHAGLRKVEVVAARAEWFDLDNPDGALLHVQNGPGFTLKDRDNRTIPITGEFLAFLKGYGLRRPYMLAPEVKQGKWRYRFDFVRRWKAHVARLGLQGITFHDLRRTFASLHVSKGTSIYKVAKWLGDDVAIVEERYGHLVAQDEQINDPWSREEGRPKQAKRKPRPAAKGKQAKGKRAA